MNKRTRGLVAMSSMVAAGMLLAGCGGGAQQQQPAAQQGNAGPTAAGSGERLVWPAPTDVSAAAERAGLPVYESEQVDVHYHGHLDVFVKGSEVPVPAGIGVDPESGRITPLHTHDRSGVVHVEAAKPQPFTLGQFFAEWGVAFSGSRLGDYRAGPGNPLRVYVNGQEVQGDPTEIRLKPRQQVVVVYGEKPRPLPTSYDFGSL